MHAVGRMSPNSISRVLLITGKVLSLRFPQNKSKTLEDFMATLQK